MERDDETLSTADLASREREHPSESAPERGGSETAETTATGPAQTSLLADDDATQFRTRWQDLQTGFVDEPRRAVQEADALVAELMQRLADTFAQERSELERQWDRGDEVSTEDLRVALQRYRSFFDRLLTT